jgi:amino acid adenylation domain-containing protein
MQDDLRTLRSGFLRSWECFPDRPALEVDAVAYSYQDLGERSAALAATLQRHSERSDPQLTAVFGHRSLTAFSGILGALFRGGGYVPLNPTFPVDRSRSMLERSECRAVVVDAAAGRQLPDLLRDSPLSLVVILPDLDDVSELATELEGHTVLGAGDLLAASAWDPAPVDPEAIAYLLFTSGSTGVPKGVMVAHRNATAFIDIVAERYAIDEHDRFSQTFDTTFDLSVFDLFVAWERGACVCCPSQAQKLLPAKYIQQSEISVWFSVPSTGVLMNRLRMLKPGQYPSLRWSLFCGEALPSEIVEAWAAAAPESTVENLYGPTELTIACTQYRWDPEHSREHCELGLVPIGEPYPGMQVLVVDENLRPVAPGGTGELLMTGPQLTPGYWCDADKTAAAFIQPPDQHETFYRTGDRVRRADGDTPMVYLGRMDNQIKIQGYRVELGEIEAVIREEAGVDVAIAIGWPETPAGADGIVVFVSDPDCDLGSVHQQAKARLPNYMAPREIRSIDDFPLNANGKVDRNALRDLLRA